MSFNYSASLLRAMDEQSAGEANGYHATRTPASPSTSVDTHQESARKHYRRLKDAENAEFEAKKQYMDAMRRSREERDRLSWSRQKEGGELNQACITR